MSAFGLNAAFNVLGAVQSYNRDKQTHANDLAQQAVNNAVARQQGAQAIQSVASSAAIERRNLGLQFLKQQKAALASQGSAAVQAAWAGIEGGTAHDLMVTVLQDAAQSEVERDINLQSVHEQTVNKTADILLSTTNQLDHRNFSKPDVLANILGLGKNVLDDARRSGKIV
jgi:hypothetical protein